MYFHIGPCVRKNLCQPEWFITMVIHLLANHGIDAVHSHMKNGRNEIVNVE